jgi:hypothetical protein
VIDGWVVAGVFALALLTLLVVILTAFSIRKANRLLDEFERHLDEED